MQKTLELLDLAKQRNGIPSDYKLAQVLGVHQPTITGYRKGKSRPDLPTSMRLAELCGLDPDQVWLAICVERAATDFDREAWQRIGARLMALDSARPTH